jgi:hypothetical protein
VVQRKSQQQGVEAGVDGKERSRGSLTRHQTQSVDDAAAEDSILMARIVAPEVEALKVVIIDKKTGDQTEEGVHCLLCKHIVM